jgi:hypothetical protein
MLCNIWGFHGSDYEEIRLLGYKTPGRTSQETHNVSATQSSRLMLCKILCFHSDNYDEYCPCDVTLYGSCKNRCIIETYRLHHQSDKNRRVRDNVISNWSTLWRNTMTFSETSVLTRSTRHNIPEDGILNSHIRGNVKSYIELTGWVL